MPYKDPEARKAYQKKRHASRTPEQKAAEAKRLKKYALEHPEAVKAARDKHAKSPKGRATKKRWSAGYKDRKNELARANYRKNPGLHRMRNRAKQARYRAELTDILGGPKCAWCGMTWAPALTFDHVQDDGAEERRRLSNLARLISYYRTRPGEARQKLQVLCGSCNLAKERYMIQFGRPEGAITYEMVRAAPWC